MSKQTITTANIRALLHDRFNDTRRYAVATEVGNATGLEHNRRLDMVIVDCYKSNNYSIEGIEIKISKADLRRELQDASKHNIFFDNIDYYSLAAPEDIIDTDLIPSKWGLYAVKTLPDGSLYLYTKRKPLSLHDERMPTIDRPFAVSLMRALSCQSPTKAQLDEARREGEERGAKRERERFNHSTEAFELIQLKEKVAAYEKLYGKFSGAWEIEYAIERFERFRNLNLSKLEKSLEWLITDMQKTLDFLQEGEQENEQ